MTVKELIEVLKTAPPDSPVLRDGGEFQGDWVEVAGIIIRTKHVLGQLAGVYIK